MFETSKNEIFHKLLEKGFYEQFDITHEEMGELAQVLNHYKRGRNFIPEVLEEIVDVTICLETLVFVLKISPQEYYEMYSRKLDRLKRRL